MSETENLPATTTVQLSVRPEEAQNNARVALISLKKILDLKKKPVIINNERYMEFEDWVALGNMYGIGVKTGDTEPVEIHGVKGAKAQAEVIRIEDGTVIGGADAYCLSDERNWKNKPFFQLASMAQTRAGSKALSNELRWVVALEGIKGTPAEEMQEDMVKRPGKPAPAQGRKPAPAKKPAPARATDEEAAGDVVDADYKVKTKTDEPETHDMSGVNLDTLKGINKNLDKWIKTCQEKNEPKTEKQVCGWCEDLLADKKLTLEEFKQVRKALGHDVK